MPNNEEHHFDPRVSALVSEIDTEFVASNRSISTSGIAVFAESAKIVPDDKILTGGPAFFRMPCPPIPAFFVIAAIKSGGDQDLVEMMDILRAEVWTKANASRMATAAYRFMQRYYPLIDSWAALWNENPESS